jgi:hypothetical protein
MIIDNADDLLTFIVSQANSGQKNWFGFPQQKIVGIFTAYQIAINHADKMSPEEVADYALRLNNAIYLKLIKGDNT